MGFSLRFLIHPLILCVLLWPYRGIVRSADQDHSLTSSVTLLLDFTHHLYCMSLFQLRQLFQLIKLILVVYGRQVQHNCFTVQERQMTITHLKLPEQWCILNKGFLPGGPVIEQYHYLTSEAAVSLYIFSEVDEVLPLEPFPASTVAELVVLDEAGT